MVDSGEGGLKRWVLKNGHAGKGKESQVGKTGEAKLGSRNVYTY